MSRPSDPFLWRDPKTGRAYVGSKYADKPSDMGPTAEIYREGPWLHIVTDRYEGHVMIHANTMPLLIKELRRLEKADRRRDEEEANLRAPGGPG